MGEFMFKRILLTVMLGICVFSAGSFCSKQPVGPQDKIDSVAGVLNNVTSTLPDKCRRVGRLARCAWKKSNQYVEKCREEAESRRHDEYDRANAPGVAEHEEAQKTDTNMTKFLRTHCRDRILGCGQTLSEIGLKALAKPKKNKWFCCF